MNDKKTNKTLKAINIILLTLFAVVGGYMFFLWVTYIDNTVTNGKAHGYEIGLTKQEAYSVSQELYRNKTVYIMYPRTHLGVGPHFEFHFDKKDFYTLSDEDFWIIYFDEGHFNSVKLYFKNDKLVKIHRHRKYFEGP